jgi:putative ABC transport system permease protein
VSRITKTAIALRIARRSINRSKLQSYLIIAIIALPMVVAGFVLSYSESTKATGEQLAHFELGNALARYQVVGPPNEAAYQLPTDSYLSYTMEEVIQDGSLVDLEKILPDAKLVKVTETSAEFETATGIGTIPVVVGEVWNGSMLGQGPVKLVSGHLPVGISEAVVSPDALSRFGIKIGDTIKVTSGLTLKVTGTIQQSSRRSLEDVVYVREGALPDLILDPRNTFYYQVAGSSPSWAEVQRLNKQGVVVLSKGVLLNPPPRGETNADNAGMTLGRVIAALFLAPLVLLPVVVLAGSAFAFGARRQTRTLAVLSSLGAERKTLRAVTLASGIWLGLFGGLVGLGLGVAGNFLFGPAVANFAGGNDTWYSYPGFRVPLGMLAIALVASVLLGAVTSLIPAIRASRVNVLATLRGARTEGAVRVRSGVGAIVLLSLGVSSIVASLLILISSGNRNVDFGTKQFLQLVGVLLGIGGAIVTIISFMVATGWVLVFIRKLLSKLGSTANFAGKDLLYNRKRYSPVIASVLTVTFVASFVASLFYGPTKFGYDNYAYRYLPGQAGLSFGVSPTQDSTESVSTEEFWASVPKLEKVDSDRKMILATGAFESATIIDSTVSVVDSGGTMNPDGTIADQFDTPSPVVIYNPDAVCYYTGLSPKSNEWTLAHATTMTQKDMKQPAGCAGIDDPQRTFVVGGVKELRAIIQGTDASAESVLSSGGVVLFNRGYDYSGRAKISWLKPSDYNWNAHNLENATKTVTLPSKLIGKITSNSFAFGAMISRETAAKYGIKAFPMTVLVGYEGNPPAAATDTLNGRNIYLEYANGTGVLNPDGFAWLIVLLAGLFSLASTGIALGLSQIEARTDKRTLSAIGAPRSFRAKLVSIQALSLTAVGSLLGALTGLMLGAAMLNGMDPEMANFPVWQLVALIVGVPALASTAFWLFTPRTLKYEVRQALD